MFGVARKQISTDKRVWGHFFDSIESSVNDYSLESAKLNIIWEQYFLFF